MIEKELSKQGIVKYYSTKLLRIIARILARFFWVRRKKEFNKKKIKKILFIQLYGIGDYLMSTPTIMAISKAFPNAEKSIYCKPATYKIAKLNPFLKKVFSKKPSENFDLIISLNDSAEAAFVARELKPKYVLGFLKGKKVFANFPIKNFFYDKKKSWVDNYLLIAKAIDCKKQSKNYVLKIQKSKKIENLLKKNKLENFIVLNANTREGAEAKNWGNKNYAVLADMLIKKGFQIVFCGGKGEKDSVKTIKLISEKKSVFDFTGKLNLKEVSFLFSKAKVFVGNDTGLMHIALAANCPTIGIFGPTNSKILFPKKENTFAFQVKSKEWPCFIRGTFNVKPNQELMNSIKPEKVFEKVLELLK